MWKTLRWKILLILVVVALAVWAFYPPWDKVKLGLDLRGGVHLVLGVETDEALQLETQQTADQLQAALGEQDISVKVAVESPTRFQVQGVPSARDGEFRATAETQVGTIYDRLTGSGGAYPFQMKPNITQQRRRETVQQAIRTIERRVNELGVTEPLVAIQGGGDQIMVQLPGVTDVDRAKEIIRAGAMLELKLVQAGPAASKKALLQGHGGKVPETMEILPGVEGQFYLVNTLPAVTGRDLRSARPTLDEFNQPAVAFSLNSEGATKFANFTGNNVNRLLGIVLDGRMQSAPNIEERIPGGNVRISGNFTQQEAADLALVLRSGALPASMTELEERTVGPTLGADSVRAGVTASIAGLTLVALFMLVYYRLAGLNAILALVLNLVILLGFMAYLGAVMTLPGIAGFILTLGIGVDSNVLIFERIREELAAQKTARNAVAAGFDRVFLTIMDTHISSLIAAAFLFQFGTGPIRGFATTLTVGLVTNIFTSLFVSRTVFEVILTTRRQALVSV